MLAACSSTYHPEFHPQSSYSYVQNISLGPPPDTGECRLGRAGDCWRQCFTSSNGEACYLLSVMFETGHDVPRNHDHALRLSALARKLGYAPATIDIAMAAPYIDLWRGGSREPRAEKCTGAACASTKVSTSAGTAEAPVSPGSLVGSVSSPGGVVVYGSLNGDVYIGR